MLFLFIILGKSVFTRTVVVFFYFLLVFFCENLHQSENLTNIAQNRKMSATPGELKPCRSDNEIGNDEKEDSDEKDEEEKLMEEAMSSAIISHEKEEVTSQKRRRIEEQQLTQEEENVWVKDQANLLSEMQCRQVCVYLWSLLNTPSTRSSALQFIDEQTLARRHPIFSNLDLFCSILHFCDVVSRLNCMRVNRHWRTIIKNPKAWLILDLRSIKQNDHFVTLFLERCIANNLLSQLQSLYMNWLYSPDVKFGEYIGKLKSFHTLDTDSFAPMTGEHNRRYLVRDAFQAMVSPAQYEARTKWKIEKSSSFNFGKSKKQVKPPITPTMSKFTYLYLDNCFDASLSYDSRWSMSELIHQHSHTLCGTGVVFKSVLEVEKQCRALQKCKKLKILRICVKPEVADTATLMSIAELHNSFWKAFFDSSSSSLMIEQLQELKLHGQFYRSSNAELEGFDSDAFHEALENHQSKPSSPLIDKQEWHPFLRHVAARPFVNLKIFNLVLIKSMLVSEWATLFLVCPLLETIELFAGCRNHLPVEISDAFTKLKFLKKLVLSRIEANKQLNPELLNKLEIFCYYHGQSVPFYNTKQLENAQDLHTLKMTHMGAYFPSELVVAIAHLPKLGVLHLGMAGGQFSQTKKAEDNDCQIKLESLVQLKNLQEFTLDTAMIRKNAATNLKNLSRIRVSRLRLYTVGAKIPEDYLKKLLYHGSPLRASLQELRIAPTKCTSTTMDKWNATFRSSFVTSLGIKCGLHWQP
jgi:hypothetical protein